MNFRPRQPAQPRQALGLAALFLGLLLVVRGASALLWLRAARLAPDARRWRMFGATGTAADRGDRRHRQRPWRDHRAGRRVARSDAGMLSVLVFPSRSAGRRPEQCRRARRRSTDPTRSSTVDVGRREYGERYPTTTEEQSPMTLKHPKAPAGPTATSPSRPSSPSKATTSRRHGCATSELPPDVAYQIIHDELMLDGNARMNLATFVTHLDGAAGREADGRVPRQEHDRQGRVPADGRARDALRQHPQPALARARRGRGDRLLDDRLERGGDARRPRAQAPLAAPARRPRASRPTSRTS